MNARSRPSSATPSAQFFLPMRAIVIFALFLTCAHVFLYMGASQRETWRDAYLSAIQWDVGWYAGLAAHGYHPSWPLGGDNLVAYFPAFPYLARLLVLLSMEGKMAVLSV